MPVKRGNAARVRTKALASDYTVSLHYDRRLYREDIAGSIAHARMLGRQGIISGDESKAIVGGLEKIRAEIESGKFLWRPELEDIHMNIEARLFDLIGDTAGKLHTARSRNDQVATDTRLYARARAEDTMRSLRGLQGTLLDCAEKNPSTLLPGYTHLQRAQPVLLAHHLLAYFEMFDRDARRFESARAAADVMPLGSGALAGLPYSIDRESVARELGFSAIASNSMDAVSDRDFLLDWLSAAAIAMMHVSRLAEEIVLWSSEEFGFVQLSDEYTTGSSIMPQKRNPDFAELARGKTGRVYGNLMAALTTLKGLPMTYNRDLQEDKERLFDTVDTLLPTLEITAGMLSGARFNEGRMRDAARRSYVLATDLADYLVRKGMPFREAHGVVADLTRTAMNRGKYLHDLSLADYRRASGLFAKDVLDINLEASIAARDTIGGTSPRRVADALKAARTRLKNARPREGGGLGAGDRSSTPASPPSGGEGG
ncbi:MAG: argininosuccinate lyase [Chloroflexi bacterium]|nr:argininosuccinate lyase [Chloroflexota bacterium]